MKHKSELFRTFKKWRVDVDNETSLKIKCLKSNNGGEYIRKELIDCYVQNGIKMLKNII